MRSRKSQMAWLRAHERLQRVAAPSSPTGSNGKPLDLEHERRDISRRFQDLEVPLVEPATGIENGLERERGTLRRAGHIERDRLARGYASRGSASSTSRSIRTRAGSRRRRPSSKRVRSVRGSRPRGGRRQETRGSPPGPQRRSRRRNPGRSGRGPLGVIRTGAAATVSVDALLQCALTPSLSTCASFRDSKRSAIVVRVSELSRHERLASLATSTLVTGGAPLTKQRVTRSHDGSVGCCLGQVRTTLAGRIRSGCRSPRQN